jgi:Thymidylate synthase
MARLYFEPLYYKEMLSRVNPEGDAGLVTLWSPVRTVRRTLERVAPAALDPARSRIAAVSNLYGDGMFAMFCNLLFNPQVRHLIAIGQDLGAPSCAEIEAFLRDGLEDATLLGQELKRVRGTERLFPVTPGFDADRLRSTLSFRYLGKLSDPELGPRLRACLDELPRGPDAEQEDRIRVDIPEPAHDDRTYLPSDVSGHQVSRRRPLDCWEELVVRCVRFGRPVTLANGPRLHLLNVKVTVQEPAEDPPSALEEHGFRLSRFREYQEAMLRPERPEGVSYTYGNRLRGYFVQRDADKDTLRSVVDAFSANPETRQAYVSLWDTSADLPERGVATPCLTTLFFRRSEGRLALAATYRVHNLLSAWLQNVYGLMAVQRYVADAVGLRVGPITVVSHFLGIDPRNERYALARAIADRWTSDDDFDRTTGKASLRMDPHGHFAVSVDHERGLIVAEHRYRGVLIKRYEAERAESIESEVSGDMAVSLPSHGMWLGRELARAQQQLHDRR